MLYGTRDRDEKFDSKEKKPQYPKPPPRQDMTTAAAAQQEYTPENPFTNLYHVTTNFQDTE